MSAAKKSRSRQWMQSLMIGPSSVEDELSWERHIALMTQAYQELTSSYPFPVESSGEKEDNIHEHETEQSLDLDPLSAMLAEEDSRNERLQQLEMKYRKERAQRKRGLLEARNSIVDDTTEEEDESDQNEIALQIIDKDLERLALPNYPNAEHICLPSRKETLRRMLYIFSCSHQESGYRQGMHEVASYCYFIMELEFADLTNPSDVITQENDNDSLAAPAYAILNAMLTALFPAYDVVVTTLPPPQPQNSSNIIANASPTTNKPLERLSWSVLDRLSQYDPTLWQMITSSLNIPPQLIFAKWIRLLFSREVDAVVEFLDEMMRLLPCVSYCESNPVLSVAEAATVARLILHRSDLLTADPADALHLIMNLPKEREENFDAFVQFMRKIAKRERVTLPVIETRLDNAIPERTAASSPPCSDESMVKSQSGKFYHNQHQHPFTPMMHDTDSRVVGGSVQNSSTAASLAGFSLSSVKEKLAVHTEKLAAQTHSIGKRLYQEWETTIAAANRHDDDQRQDKRNYGEPTVARIVTFDDPLGAHTGLGISEPGTDHQVISPTSVPSFSAGNAADMHRWTTILDHDE